MTRRIAALFALFAFAVAWLVGVWRGHAPLTRVENAAIALASGLLAGFGVGLALERIVLHRFSAEWQARTEAPEPEAPAGAAKPAGAAAPASAPAPVAAPARAPRAAEAVAANGEARR
jgi:hypothetical protein